MIGSLILDPGEMLEVDPGDEFDELLAEPAGAVTTLLPDYDPADENEDIAEAAGELLLQEGIAAYIKAKFEEAKHPRWPKDTPGGKGGEFMQIGERFLHDGKPYEISAFHDGKVLAHLATGDPNDIHEIELTPKKAAGKATLHVEVAPPKAIQGDKSHSSHVAGTVVINPYVDPESHDPSIAKPKSLHLSDEEWARFGRIDQEHFLEVEKRFGEWSPGKSATIISELQHQYDGEIQQIISQALASQYGSSSGYTLSLAQVFSGGAGLAGAQKQYEKAKLLLRDTAEAIHWDLYHRTKSPDVAMFHWGNTSPTQQKKLHIQQGIPLLAAYSMSTGAFATTDFGDQLTAIPMAIRHVEMHTHSGGVHVSYEGEYEITTGARLKLDDRTLFTSSDMPSDVRSYLHKMAKTGGEPASGAILYEAKKALKDQGYDLPIPPEQPGISAMPVGVEQLYTEIPADVAAKAGAMVQDLPYSGGSQEAAKGTLELLGVKPGDFIEGLKGTRYVIIADPGDTTSGLRYVKIEPGTKLPNYGKSFPFSASAGNPFYRLEGHIDIPEPKVAKDGFVPFTAAQYAELMDGPPEKLSSFGAGDMFKVDGVAYELVGPHNSGKVQVKSMDDGKMYLANSGYKGAKLVPTGSYTPPPTAEELAKPKEWQVGEPVVVGGAMYGHVLQLPAEPGDGILVQTPTHPDGTIFHAVTLAAPPEMPGVKGTPEDPYQPGDKFAYGGMGPFTITSILKSGTVRAKLSGGKVTIFEPDDLKKYSIIYRPSTFAVGNKAKVGDLDIGDAVQAGAGEKVRPYVVIGKVANSVYLSNLETGETVKVTKNKTYARLLDKQAVDQAHAPGPGEKALKPELVNKLVPGPPKTLGEMEVGDTFAQDTGSNWVVVETDEKGVKAQLYTKEGHAKGDPQTFYKSAYGSYGFEMLVPPSDEQKAAKPELNSKFDLSKYHHGDQSTLSDLDEGSLFMSATGIPMQLKSKNPKGGATAVAMHNGKTVKNIPYDKPFTTLVEKDEVPPEHAALAYGDPVALSELKAGDVFHDFDGKKWVVVTEGTSMTNPTLSPVTPEGVKQFGTYTGYGPQKLVAYAGTMDDQKPIPPVPLTHADELPTPPIYNTYLHAKSGPNHYPLVSSMAVGTVFTDKSGHTFKVKQSGGQTVVTESGTDALYSVMGHWRGKVAPEAAFVDSTTMAEQPDHSDGKPTVGDLSVGDKFTIPEGYVGAGEEYEVTSNTPNWTEDPEGGGYTTFKVKPTNPGSHADGGFTDEVPITMKPAQVTKAGQVSGITPDDPNIGEKLEAKKAKKVKHPMFKAIGGAVPMTSDDMPDYGYAATASGKVVYKAPNGKLFELGKGDAFTGMHTGLTPVRWIGTSVSDADLEPMGDTKVSTSKLAVGDHFYVHSKDGPAYQVIAKGDEGIHAQAVGSSSGMVAWAAHAKGGSVLPAQIKGQGPPPLEDDFGDEIKPGMFEGDLPHDFQENLGAVKLSDLPVGSFYATPALNGFEMKKIVKEGPLVDTGHGTIQGVSDYKPDWFLLPPNWPPPGESLLDAGPSVGPLASSEYPLLGQVPVGAVIDSPGYGKIKKTADTATYAMFEDAAGKKYTYAPTSNTPSSWRLDPDWFMHGPALPPLPKSVSKPGHEKLSNMPVGTKFKGDDGETYEVVTTSPGGNVIYKGLEGTHIATPFEAKSQTFAIAPLGDGEVAPGEWEPSTDYSELPPGIKPNTAKLSIKDLPVGSYYAYAAVNEVSFPVLKITKAGMEPEADVGMTQPGHPNPNYVPEYVWTPTSAAEPVSAEVTFQQVKDGGTFTYGGNTYLKLGHGSLSGWAQKATGVDSGEKKSFALKSMVQAAPEHVADEGNPLEPYLHGKSGKYKYVHLNTLAAGTEFTDKKAGKYKVIGHVGGFTQFLDGETGKTHSAPSTYRVKVTKPATATDLSEAIVRVRGDGRVLLGV